MRQVSKDEFDAYISEYDYYLEYNEELKVKNAPYNEYFDIKENRTDRLLGRISEFLSNHELKYVYEIQEVKTMSEIIINKEQHECPPEVAAYIKELKAENARLEEGYQKSVGVIAATDCVECKRYAIVKIMKVLNGWGIKNEVSAIIKQLENEIDELKTENEALHLLIEWAEECDFGYDNFPEEYERYKNELDGMGYIEGMIHIAKRVCQQKRGANNA